MLDTNLSLTVTKENILYKCGWSPLENFTFPASIEKTFVSGNLVYNNGAFDESIKGKRLLFKR
jgi:dihydroorotase